MAFRSISLTYFAIVLSIAFAMLNVNPFLRSAKQTVSQMRLGSSIVPTLCTTPSAAINNGSFKDAQFSIKILEAHFPLAAYPTREDTQVIEQRQIMRTATSLFGVENSRCKHGFPQAYVQYPVGGGISSGMIRLSCPHLVKAVDEMESDGALNDFDAKLADEAEGLSLRVSFNDTNLAWRSIRKSAVTMEDREYMDEKLGIEGTKFLMDSGIIGCTIGKLQVKCLHAHIGDHLMRGTNEIGKEALAKLETRGLSVSFTLLGKIRAEFSMFTLNIYYIIVSSLRCFLNFISFRSRRQRLRQLLATMQLEAHTNRRLMVVYIT